MAPHRKDMYQCTAPILKEIPEMLKPKFQMKAKMNS